jgi:RNA polymerase sigma factor (sigma-70 family)
MRLNRRCDELWVELRENPTRELFEEFYLQSRNQVFVFCKKILHEFDPTEETVQAIYAKLWTVLKNRKTVICRKNSRSKSSELPATAAAALQRFAQLEIDHQRKSYHSEQERRVDIDLAYDLEDPTPALPQLLSDHESIQLVYEVLGILSAEESSAFDLHFFEGLSSNQIAIRLQVSRSTVTRRIARAAERVRRALTNDV